MLKHLLLALVTLLPTTVQAYQVEGWDIALFPDTRNPTGCIMGGTFQDGTRLSIVVTDKIEWALALSNNNWNLTRGGSTDVAIYVDRKFVASGKAAHFNEKIGILPFGRSNTYQALRSGHRLDIQTPAGNLNFELKGTAKAMMAVLQCAGGLKQQPPTTTSSGQRPGPDSFAMVPQAETTTLVTNLLNAAGVRGYRLDPPPANGQHVTYQLADGTKGFVLAARGRDTKSADEYTSVVITRAAAECTGEFISAKKAVPSVDGSVVREVFTTCKTSEGTSATATTIIRQSSGFLIDLSQSVPSSLTTNTDPESSSSRASIMDAAIRLKDIR